jgi:hypothetical protein
LDVLNKSISTAAACALLLLKLDKLESAKWLKDVGEVSFCNGEMNIADVETMNWHAWFTGAGALCRPGLAVLLGFRMLCDDWDA